MKYSNPYDSAFYAGQRRGSHRSAELILPIVKEIISPRSVCDVGCGVGSWLSVWRDLGVDDIRGMDGDYVDKSQMMIDPGKFVYSDLRRPLLFDRSFDLALSLEVAEHLPPDRGKSFVAELSSAAPVVLFSAAIPGQGGTDHINEQWQEYWADLFRARGFTPFDCIRPIVWNNKQIERWYRQNIILYCRNDKIADYPLLSTVVTMPLSIVHPQQYTERSQEYGVHESLSFLTGSVRRAAERRLRRLLVRQ
jgi:SAM-dependent methyltransferase